MGRQRGNLKVQTLAYHSDTIWLLFPLPFSQTLSFPRWAGCRTVTKWWMPCGSKSPGFPELCCGKLSRNVEKKNKQPLKQLHSSLIHSLGKLSPKVSKYNSANAVLQPKMAPCHDRMYIIGLLACADHFTTSSTQSQTHTSRSPSFNVESGSVHHYPVETAQPEENRAHC